MAHRDLADLRREYRNRPLRRTDLKSDPFLQFDDWFSNALEVEAMDANAMYLSTVNKAGAPSSRTVLLKYYDQDGLIFYTNLGSNKAKDINQNPQVALLFYWHEVHRQVKIVGNAERTAILDDARYFLRRPRDSQIGAWVSHQSSVLTARAALESQFTQAREKFGDGEIPLPSFWGGYRVVPNMMEFWQGRENRLHDRFRFDLRDGEWSVDRLAP